MIEVGWVRVFDNSGPNFREGIKLKNPLHRTDLISCVDYSMSLGYYQHLREGMLWSHPRPELVHNVVN